MFYPEPGNEAVPGIVIPFIYREAVSLRWRETDTFLSAEVPFSSDFHMMLSMPKERPLRDCLGDPKCLAEMLTAPPARPGPFFLIDTPSFANLYLPSFQIDSHIDLKGLLRDMGFCRAFDETSAELTGIASEYQYIQSARQDTIVEVNAEGAAAYAKTAFVLTTTASMPSIKPLPKQLCFDRPFLFAIWKDAPDPDPLFVGTFQKPQCP